MLITGVNTWFVMAGTASSQGVEKSRMAAVQLSARLKNCWSVDVNWNLYPPFIREVSCVKGLSMPLYIQYGNVSVYV